MNHNFTGTLPRENKRASFLLITTELSLSGLKLPQINLNTCMFMQHGSKIKKNKESIFKFLANINQQQMKPRNDVAEGTLNTTNISMRPDAPVDNTAPAV